MDRKQENQRFIKEIIQLALPAGLQQVIHLTVSLIDNLMIGSLGEASISAVAICGTYMWLGNTFVNGLTSGAVIIAAQDWGSKNVKRIRKLLSLMLVVSLLIGFFFFVLTSLFPEQILMFYSNSKEIIKPGVGYLNYIKYSFPMVSVSTAVMLMLRSVRSVKLGLINSLLSCLVNVFFNWVFIYGNLGAPAMGAAGAALGTTIAYFVQMIVSLIYLFIFEKNLRFRISHFNPWIEWDLLKKFISISAPLLATDLMYNFSSTVQTMITGRISTNYLSANSIVHMSWQIPDVFCLGVAMASGIMIGNALGAKNYERALADSKRFTILSVGIGLFNAVAIQLILPNLLQFYEVTEATQILARQMGVSASINMFFSAFCSILANGVIKSGGSTRQLMRIDIISIWLIAVPLGFIGAFVLNWPAPVLYLVLRSGTIIKTFWALIRIKKADWMINLN